MMKRLLLSIIISLFLCTGVYAGPWISGGSSGGSGDIATDTIWAAAGDLVYGTGNDTASVLSKGTAYQLLMMNSGATAPAWTSTLGATGTRLTKGWFTDLEITNAPTINGAAWTTILQPLDADLTTIAGLTVAEGKVIIGNSSPAWSASAFTLAAPSTSGNILKSDGTNWTSSNSLSLATLDMTSATSSIPWVLAADCSTTTTNGFACWDNNGFWLSIGNGSAAVKLYGTTSGSITSAELLGSLSDETGTGVAVFATSPSFTTSILPAASTTTLGSAAAEWGGLYLGDGKVIYFQADQSVYLTPSAGTLTLTGAFASTSTITSAATASPYIALLDSDAAGTAVTDEETMKIYAQQTTTTEDGEVGDWRIASVGGSAAGTWNTNVWWDGSAETLYLGVMTDADAPAAIAGSENLKVDFNTTNDNEITVGTDSGATHIRTDLQITDKKTIAAKTANYTVTALDMGGVLTNEGDDGTAIFTLPEASTVLGKTITFVVLATQVLNINPADGTDQILYGGCAAGDSLQADAIGETIVLMAVTANQWAVLSLVGTWTDAD